MKTRILLSILLLFLFTQLIKAQPKPAEPTLRMRLQKYVSDNHLYPGGTYIYFDTTTKKPYRFSPKDFLVEDVSLPVPSVVPSLPATTNRILAGGNFHLVKDINSMTNANPLNLNSSLPSASFAVLNNVSYFSADDGIHGSELWRSDGTKAGTYMVKDINKGETNSQPQNIITSGNQLFFIVDNGNGSSYSLWKSDGTEAGTQELLNTAGKEAYIYYTTLCDVNGEVYFVLSTLSSTTNQLWKTDGTEEGTMLVKDFGITGHLLHNLVSANGLLFFVAATDAYGEEVWRSDGTESGTFILDDINPSSNIYDGNGPSQLTAYNGKLYFAANDGTGNKLWVTDGTPEGTTYANGYNNILLWNFSYYAFGVDVPFTISNNIMYFMGNQPATGWELYKYDAASGEGITLVKDIVPGTEGIYIPPAGITNVNGTVYFSPSGSDNYTLYKTNGTADSTVVVKQLQNEANFYNLTNGNGKLYFISSDPANGTEPWISDGTEEGTVLLKDIYKGSISSYPDYFTACNGRVLFHASDSLHGSELWVSDGTSANLVTDINTISTASANPYEITPFKDGVVMTAYTFDKGVELWFGNKQNANFVWENLAGQRSSVKRNFTVKNDVAYFITDNGEQEYFIYKTDGTTAGTIPVVSASEQIISFTVTDNGTIFYVKSNISGGQQLWKNNGTPDNNTLLLNSQFFLYDIDSKYGDYKMLTPLGNTIYFSADDPVTATELWKSDGTVAGTQLVKDIIPGTAGSSPQEITVYKNELYFRAWDGNETGLWKSDGTSLGTIKLRGVYPYDFTESNGSLFFAGGNNATGQELWKTNGTPEGTVLVRDILNGSGSSSPSSLTDVEGTLFFSASDSTHDNQIWKSDGTKTGTQLVKDIAPLTDDIYIKNLTSAAGKLFFTDINGAVWESDGTSNGTTIITDDVLNGLSADFLTANGNQLFFVGQNYLYGNELYEGDASVVVLPVTLASFNASLKNTDVITQWQTASEINTSYFNVQRSTDATHFTTAGTVIAKGNSNTIQSYSFPDVNIANFVSAKTIYYLLQTLDKDGKTSYSKIVPVTLNSKEAIVLLRPNPVKDRLKIQVNNYAGKITIDLYDLSGKKLTTSQQTVQSGSEISINASSLQAGVYVIKANLNGKTSQQKFIKE